MNYILHLSLVLYSFWWCCCFHCCWLCCWFCFFFWCRCFCSYWRIITKSNSFQNWENSLDGLKRQVISLHSIKLLNLVCFWSTLLKIGLVLGNWTISIIQKTVQIRKSIQIMKIGLNYEKSVPMNKPTRILKEGWAIKLVETIEIQMEGWNIKLIKPIIFPKEGSMI